MTVAELQAILSTFEPTLNVFIDYDNAYDFEPAVVAWKGDLVFLGPSVVIASNADSEPT